MDLSHLVVAVISACAGAILMRKQGQADGTFAADPAPKPRLTGGERIFVVVFLAGWLIAWTFGILMAASALLTGASGPVSVFIFGWLIAAIAGWGAAMHTLVRALRGKRSIFSGRML